MSSGSCEHRRWADVTAALGHDRALVVCTEHAGTTSAHHASDGTEITLTVSTGDPAEQHPAPFPAAVISASLLTGTPETHRAATHHAVHHLDRGGVLALDPVVSAALAPLCTELGMTRIEAPPIADGAAVVYRRAERTTVHDLLWAARATIRRVGPHELCGELGAANPPIVVDTRTHTDRCRSGVIPGSIHIPRTVLEWHLDASNGYRHPVIATLDDPLVVVCNGGYSSSLAAANLVEIGFTNVRDLIGGMRSWLLAGLPVTEPDHAHLDLLTGPLDP